MLAEPQPAQGVVVGVPVQEGDYAGVENPAGPVDECPCFATLCCEDVECCQKYFCCGLDGGPICIACIWCGGCLSALAFCF